jgi:hypothetical protein
MSILRTVAVIPGSGRDCVEIVHHFRGVGDLAVGQGVGDGATGPGGARQAEAADGQGGEFQGSLHFMLLAEWAPDYGYALFSYEIIGGCCTWHRNSITRRHRNPVIP